VKNCNFEKLRMNNYGWEEWHLESSNHKYECMAGDEGAVWSDEEGIAFCILQYYTHITEEGGDMCRLH